MADRAVTGSSRLGSCIVVVLLCSLACRARVSKDGLVYRTVESAFEKYTE